MNQHVRVADLTDEEFETWCFEGSEVDEEAELLAVLQKIGPEPGKDHQVTGIDSGPNGPTGPSASVEVAAVNAAGETESAQTKSSANISTQVDKSAVIVPVGADGTTFTDLASSVPDGFVLFNDGVYEIAADDATDPVFICTPLGVKAVFADNDGRGWGRLITVKSMNDQWHEIPVTNAGLTRSPGDVIATLVDHGLDYSTDKKTKDRLLRLLKQWKPSTQLQSVNRMGWVDEEFNAFVMGTTIVGRQNVLPLSSRTGIGTGLALRGGADDWKREVGLKCRENPLMVLAVSLAFSGPLLAPLGFTGGGLHFRGASSSGKTTLLNVAASVWGGRQIISQWRATTNGLEAIAATLNDMLLPLDEIAEISARDLHNSIYMLANGVGKARMTKDVTLADQARWRLALISSGEISVQEKLAEAHLDAMAGHEVRLIDIEADSRSFGAFDNLHNTSGPAAFADALQCATRDFHGQAGHSFVQKLTDVRLWERRSDFQKIVDDRAANWIEKLPGASNGQIDRVAKRFALIGLAGELATRFGLTGWNESEAFRAAEQALADWYERRYGARRDAADAFVKTLQDFLAENLNSMPYVGGPHVESAEPMGWRDDCRIYLTRETWAKIFNGEEGVEAAKALLGMQMLLPGDGGHHTRKAPRPIPGPRQRLYTVIIDHLTAYKAE